MEKGILLNDEGLKVNCIIENDNIIFEFDKNLEFLNDLLRIEKSENLTFVYLGLKKILRIENGNVERILSVKPIDIKILRALYESNNSINSRNMLDYFSSVKNNISSYSYKNKTTTRALGIIPKTKTETHVYLTEILDAKELIRFLNEYDVKYPMNEYGSLDFSSNRFYRYDEIEYYGWTNNLENALKVNLAYDVNSEKIDIVLRNREQLLKLACTSLEEMLGDSVEWKKIETDIKEASDDIVGQIKSLEEYTQNKSKEEKKKFNKEKIRLNEKLNKLNKLKSSQSAKILYNELLNISLDKLTNSKVDYSIISFSNDARIDFMSMKHKNDKRFNFLFSIDKSKNVKKFDDYAKSLESLFKNGKVLGSDITGFDTFDNSEYDSFKEKMEWLLPVLHIHPNSFLRFNATGFVDSTYYMYSALNAIREVSNKINEACVDLFGSEWGIIPPPMIRIAYGLRLEGNVELVNFVKDFGAVIEYNLKSNRALRNMKDYSKISLAFYDKNKIKYVFSNGNIGLYYYDEKGPDVIVPIKEPKKRLLFVDKSAIMEENKNPEPKIEVPLEEVSSNEVIKDIEETTEVVNEPIREEIVSEPIREEESLDDYDDEDDFIDSNGLEKTLFDIFSDLKKDNTTYDSYQEALAAENELFTLNDNVLSENEKVNDELIKIRNYITLNNMDLDNEYLENKIKIINAYNDNNSDFAKMYVFLLEREMFPELSTSFKSIEYLYQHKNNEKDNYEKELNKVLNDAIEKYDSDFGENIVS